MSEIKPPEILIIVTPVRNHVPLSKAVHKSVGPEVFVVPYFYELKITLQEHCSLSTSGKERGCRALHLC
jgi:hypothetical protein